MAEPVLVADSSPLIGLARIQHLDLLPKLARRVVVPPSVWEEVTVQGAGSPGAGQVAQARWIEVEAPDPLRVRPLRILVNAGEAEALALAQGLPGALLLVDDARARRLAERLEVPRVGTVGLLRRAKLAGLVRSLRPLLRALQESGIYIRQALIDAVLKDVGE